MYSFLFVGIFSVQVSLARVGLAICDLGGCPDGYFCHEKVCKKCLRCDILFRQGNFCVTDFNDCKDCIEGYEEVLLTEFSNTLKPCKPIKKKVKLKACDNDNNCPQNNYCNDESCIQCFECKLLNRVPPAEKCAKGLNDCGSCMIGYKEVSVTTEARYKPCEKDTVVDFSDSFKPTFSIFAPLGCILILLVCVIGIIFRKRFNDDNSTKTVCHRPIYPSAPPLYTMNTPEYVRKVDTVEPAVLGFAEERIQQAKVFKEPTARYYYAEVDADQTDNSSPENTDGPESAQLEDNCSPRIILNELPLDELVTDPQPQQPNETSNDDGDSCSIETLELNVVDDNPVPENSSDEVINDTENLREDQR